MENASLLAMLHIPKVMAILNITTDSFSDGALYLNPDIAIQQAEALIESGTDVIDLGAESTRPGAETISEKMEWDRIEPVLKHIKKHHPDQIVSIDTQKSYVAEKALNCGAEIINDVSALLFDPNMTNVIVNNTQAQVILMHMQGRPNTMQINPQYEDVVNEVCHFLQQRIAYCESRGISQDRILIDPGIGFGKNLEHNLQILANLDRFSSLNVPLVLGASRKSFIDRIDPSPPDRRLGGSLATTMLACLSNVQYIRIHDLQEHQQFLKVIAAVCKENQVS